MINFQVQFDRDLFSVSQLPIVSERGTFRSDFMLLYPIRTGRYIQ
jgi:hypothetical protein